MSNTNMPNSLRRRLLDDIAEIQQDPYPNVHLHFDDADINKACLILTPENENPLHLTINFPHNYPLRAPEVTIQSSVVHPNVFSGYICASILNTEEGWTPAYTLKGIVIQLLSFFCSDSLEQDHGGTVNFVEYRAARRAARARDHHGSLGVDWDDYWCDACGFEAGGLPLQTDDAVVEAPAPAPQPSKAPRSIVYPTAKQEMSKLFSLPDEIVLLLLAELGTRDILAFANAIPTIKSLVYSYDCLRILELQCFCLKKSFMDTKLGIGVSIQGRGRRPVFRSEFDLLSQEAFFQHEVRRSVQGVEFEKWLPLPLSRGHWKRVQSNAIPCLEGIYGCANMDNKEPDYVDVLYHFMNNIVVQFSADAEKCHTRSKSRSTLNHASEKAVEAYFSLFHLFLCLATENPAIVTGANRIVSRFLTGPRTKTHFPDLGHVLVAALISNAGLTEDLTFKIIKEAILRNVIWMLDTKGAGMAELAYLEPSTISDYRLTMTFHASRTSYRLLMFLKLFSSAARHPAKSLIQLREDLFDSHGAPPLGTSSAMAQRIRKIHEIDSFPGFLTAMGIKNIPSKTEFTSFLRRTITDSVEAGYSRMPMSQSQLYMIRREREKNVERAVGVEVTPALQRLYERGEMWFQNGWNGRPTFFPHQDGQGGGSESSRGGRGSRGRGRGNGRGRGRAS